MSTLLQRYRDDMDRDVLMLTADEQKAAARAGDIDALVKSLLPLALSIAHRYSMRYKFDAITLDELVAQANLSLVIAAQSWSPDGGRSAANWAWTAIARDLGRYVRTELTYAFSRFSLDKELGDYNSMYEALGSVLAEGADPDPQDVVARDQLMDYILCNMDQLTERQADIMTMLYFRPDGGMTQVEVAEALGISKQAVNSSVKASLTTLRKLA